MIGKIQLSSVEKIQDTGNLRPDYKRYPVFCVTGSLGDSDFKYIISLDMMGSDNMWTSVNKDVLKTLSPENAVRLQDVIYHAIGTSEAFATLVP